MKQAADRFLTIIEESGMNAQVAVVPFTAMVNVGTGQPFVTGSNHPYFDEDPWAGCVFERSGTGMHSAAYDGSENGNNGKWHTYLWPPEPDPHRVSPGKSDYCLNESNGTGGTYFPGPYETSHVAGWTTAGAPTSPMTFGPNLNCVRHEIMPLTAALGQVRYEINSLTAPDNLGTIIAPGVAWGHRVLSPEAPYTQGAGERNDGRKIMIVLTDGEQTTSGMWAGIGGCDDYDSHSDGTPFYFNPADFKLPGNIINGDAVKTAMTPYGYILNSDPLGTGVSSRADEMQI